MSTHEITTEPTQGSGDEPPIFLTHFTQRVEMIMTPILGFALSMLIFILTDITKFKVKHYSFMIVAVVLMSCCLATCLGLMVVYQRAKEDPSDGAWVRFFSLTLYSSGFLGLILSFVAVFFPGKAGLDLGFGFIACAILLVIVGIVSIVFEDYLPAPIDRSDQPQAPVDAEQKELAMKHFLDMFHFMVVPFGGFSIGLFAVEDVVGDEVSRSENIIPCVLLALSVVISFWLLYKYHKSTEDISQIPIYRLLHPTLYTFVLLAWGLLSARTVVPVTTRLVIFWTLIISAGVFILMCILSECIPYLNWPSVLSPEPRYLKSHLQKFLYIILPMASFSATLLLLLNRRAHDKIKPDLWLQKHFFIFYLGWVLVALSVAFGIIISLFYRYFEFDVYPTKKVWIRFFRAAFYTSGFSAWALSTTTTFIADQAVVVKLWWAILGGACFCVVFATLVDNLMRFLGHVKEFFAAQTENIAGVHW